jgi:hypothetical protein
VGDAHTAGGEASNGFDLNVQHVSLFLWTELDLNLPLDEFGAVDFDFLQNIPDIYLNSC